MNHFAVLAILASFVEASTHQVDTNNPVAGYTAGAPVSAPASSSSCIDFGVAGNYNAFIRKDFQASSDIQGRLAVGGNGKIASGYSIADQLTGIKQCSEYTAVFGGSLEWPGQGQNYFGNIAVGVSSPNINPQVLNHGCTVDVKPGLIDFDSAFATLKKASDFLAGLSDTVIAQNVKETVLTLQFSGKSKYEVVTVNGDVFMGTVKTIEAPSGVLSGSIIVFNIKGKSAGMTNMNMEALADFNVIFNFMEASEVTLKGIAVRGTVLAPNADINEATGVIYGSLYANSFCGPMQINLKPITCSDPPKKCKLRPTTTMDAVPYSTPSYGVITSVLPVVYPTTTPAPKCRPRTKTVDPPAPSTTPCSKSKPTPPSYGGPVATGYYKADEAAADTSATSSTATTDDSNTESTDDSNDTNESTEN